MSRWHNDNHGPVPIEQYDRQSDAAARMMYEMAKKTKVREHQRNQPARKSPPEREPADAVRDWLRKENDKTQEGFREWETVTPERGRK